MLAGYRATTAFTVKYQVVEVGVNLSFTKVAWKSFLSGAQA
jgi:hypothetical protein